MAEGTHDDGAADVLILGASFAGIELVHQLRRSARGRGLKITVVDRQAEHPYIPLVQERLVGRLDPAKSVLPTRRSVEQKAAARYVVGDVVELDPDRKEVVLASGERLRGRFIVVALGSVLAPPAGIEGAERFVDYKFEGEFASAAERLAALLGPGGEVSRRVSSGDGPYREGEASGPVGERPTIVVAGGGISGVELAGDLGRLARVRPAGWRAPKVTLIHSGPRLLPHLCERAGRKAEQHLRAQGVELRLNTRLTRLAPGTAAVRPVGPGGDAVDVPCDMAFGPVACDRPPCWPGCRCRAPPPAGWRWGRPCSASPRRSRPGRTSSPSATRRGCRARPASGRRCSGRSSACGRRGSRRTT
ncbi:NAD(P)/FAD-dependent oxidoreductase [Nannocystis pusilla]|uniref:NAD(P)/FAD-dependent oxidoreductase n=1 Tax=Nannocystis pusilla TaxID=889268 RepID=UPI003B7A8BFF